MAIEAQNDQTAAVISGFRNRLLAEHLDCTPEAVADAVDNCGSLIDAIESLRGNERSLRELDGFLDPDLDALIPQSQLIDPEHPMDAEMLTDQFINHDERRLAGSQLLVGGLILLGLMLLAAAWRWTPLGEWLDLQRIVSGIDLLKQQPLTPLLVLAAFVIAGFLIIPVTLLVVACA